MEYSKLKKLASTDDEALALIVEKLAEEMERTCKACNSDRITCSFSPKCEGRWWLDMRIEAGVPKSKLSQFCYQRRGEEIKRFLKQKGTLVKVEDARFYLKDFFELIGKKNIAFESEEEQQDAVEAVVTFLRKFWQSVQTGQKDSKVFIFLNNFDTILQLDFSKNLMKVNMKKERIKEEDTLLFLLRKGEEILGLDFEIFRTPTTLWMNSQLDNLPSKDTKTLVDRVKETGIPFSRVNDGEIVIGLTKNPTEPKIKFATLQALFTVLSESPSSS